MQHVPTAIIYAYGEDTPDWGGVPQQIHRCEAYAARHDIRIRDVVREEKWHGPALTRPAFRPLFAALTAMPEPPAYLLVTTVDRVGRRMDLEEGSYIEARLRNAGVQLLVVDAERIVSIMGTDLVASSPPDPTPNVLRNIRRTLEDEYRREEERQQIRCAARVQLYSLFLAQGGWPAVHAVDGTAGFAYRRWQRVSPGEYQPTPDDLPMGEGTLLPGPADELHCVQRLHLAIGHAIYSSVPLPILLQQHVGEDWTPARALAVMADTTLSRIGIPGWELFSPAQLAQTGEYLQEWISAHAEETDMT